jgi:DNA polymerase III sliding clamp (beta) subunit (PCNA family)
MKLSVDAKALRKGIEAPYVVATGKGSYCKDVLLEAAEGVLKISASNGNAWVTSDVECDVKKSGSLALLAETISKLTLGSGVIHFELKDGSLSAKRDKSIYKLPWKDKGDFAVEPEILTDTGFSCESLLLAERIKFAMRASEGAKRQSAGDYDGVHLDFRGEKIIVQATDRVRISHCEVDTESPTGTGKLFIPSDAVPSILTLLESSKDAVSVRFDQSKIGFWCGGTYLIANLFDKKFPDLDKIVNREGKPIGIYNRKEMDEACRRLAIVDDDTETTIRVLMGDKTIRLRVTHAGTGGVGDETLDYERTMDSTETDFYDAVRPFSFHYWKHASCGFKSDQVVMTTCHNSSLIFSDGQKRFLLVGRKD